MKEVIADYKPHWPGEREIVSWDRPDGTYFNVPIIFLREVTLEDYLAQKPHMAGHPELGTLRVSFWEVSVD